MKVLSSIRRKFHLPTFVLNKAMKAMSLKLQKSQIFLLFPDYEESGCGLITPEDGAHSFAHLGGVSLFKHLWVFNIPSPSFSLSSTPFYPFKTCSLESRKLACELSLTEFCLKKNYGHIMTKR